MATRDWVPLEFYDDPDIFGLGSGLAAGTQDNITLFDPDWLANQDGVQGQIEDSTKFKVIRMVGYWTVFATSAGAPLTGEAYVQIRPSYRINNSYVVAGNIAGGPGAASARTNNDRFLWERIVPAADIQDPALAWDRANSFAIPFHIMLDISPDMWISDNENLSVVLYNNTESAIRFHHRWRAYCMMP